MKTHLLFVLAATLCSGPTSANEVTKVLIGKRGDNELPYILSLPDDYENNANEYPVLVYLHGAAENGTDLTTVGIPGGGGPPYGQWEERFILIAPQCPPGKHWDVQNCAYVKGIIDYEKKELRIDDDRVCLTGFSMGGYGTYGIVGLYPKYFAIANPIVGAGTWIKASALKHIPFWSVVTVKDSIVPIADCQATIDKLRAAGAYVRSTVFADLPHHLPRHRCWKDTFIFDWMFAQRRGTPHNYHLAVVDGSLESPSNKNGDGFFEPKTVHAITTRAPDRAKDEVFTGWTSSPGMGRFWAKPDYPKHKSTTHPTSSAGSFANAKALTTAFTMPANDVIITANYAINPK